MIREVIPIMIKVRILSVLLGIVEAECYIFSLQEKQKLHNSIYCNKFIIANLTINKSLNFASF